MQRRLLFRGICLIAGVAALITGCFRAEQAPLAAAATTGQCVALQPKVTWRRKPLSLRTLGRVMQASRTPVDGRQPPISRAVVSWAAPAVLPDGIDQSTDLDRLGDILFHRVSGAGQPPADLAILNH
jgi:hypothetical protein